MKLNLLLIKRTSSLKFLLILHKVLLVKTSRRVANPDPDCPDLQLCCPYYRLKLEEYKKLSVLLTCTLNLNCHKKWTRVTNIHCL